MANSKVEIWNKALGHLSSNKLVSNPNENSMEAKQCRIFYDGAREAALRDYPWAFAKRQQTLALTGTAPDGWDYQYAYPSDCLSIRRIYNIADPKSEEQKPIKYTVAQNPDGAGRVIWTDQAEAQLIYTRNVDDVSYFDPQFEEALSLILAARLAKPINGKRQDFLDAMEAYRIELNKAKTADANENFIDKDYDADWIKEYS